MKNRNQAPSSRHREVAKPFGMQGLGAAAQRATGSRAIEGRGTKGGKGAKGTKHGDDGQFDRNTINSTLNRHHHQTSDDLDTTNVDAAYFDTDEDGVLSDGDAGYGFEDPAGPFPDDLPMVQAPRDWYADLAADEAHLAACLMVDTLALEIPNIASVDETGMKKAYGQFDDDRLLKDETDWRKGALTAPTGKRSLRVRHVKKTKRLQIEGSSAINTQGQNVVSSGDVTMLAYWMCRDVHKKLALDLPIEVGHELVHGRLVKVTRIDVALLLKIPEGLSKGALINALAIAGICAGTNSSLYINKTVYFDQNSQTESSKLYDKAAELKRARKGGLPDVDGVELLIELNENTIRLECVFRAKKLTQVAKKLGAESVPATFSKEVLARMVLDLLRKHVAHGQIIRRLDAAELRAIPLPYRSAVAHWQNGMHLPDMFVSERALKEQARHIKQNYQIDIEAPPPDSLVVESLSLMDVLAPQNFMPVPAEIRSNPELFKEIDMAHHRATVEAQLASKAAK